MVESRMQKIRAMTKAFLEMHTLPFSIKKAFDYAKTMDYVYFMTAMIKHIGATIENMSALSSKQALDIVSDIDFRIGDSISADIDFVEIVNDHIIKKLLRFGRISAACKMAKCYGVTDNSEKDKIYNWLLQIYNAQNEKFARIYKNTEMAEGE